MDDEIAAELEGPAEVGGGESIVDHERHAGIVRDRGDLAQIHHLEAGVAERLAEDEARRGPDRRLEGGGLARVDEGRGDAEAGERVMKEIVAAAVDRGRGDDVPAQAHEGGDAEMEGGLAARGADRTDPALEGCDALLEHRRRRVRDARVDVADALEVEEACGVVHVLEDIRGRLVDRHGARTRGRIGTLAGMKRQGVELEVLGIDHGITSK